MVNSSRFSGTNVASSGLTAQAMSAMADTAAISRLRRLVTSGPQRAQIVVLNVSAILAQMDGDAVGAAEQSQHRRRHRIGFVRSPCLPHGGHMIDVDAQANHDGLSFLGVITSRKFGGKSGEVCR